jgi:hypothetical protein
MMMPGEIKCHKKIFQHLKAEHNYCRDEFSGLYCHGLKPVAIHKTVAKGFF